MDLKHIQNVLTLNGDPNWLLNRKLKIKSDPLFATPATRNAVETRRIAILPYVSKLSEKLKPILLSHGIRTAVETRRIAILPYVSKLLEKLKPILLSHGIRTVSKPSQKLGSLLSSFENAIEPGYRQGAIYKINCSDCNLCCTGETKRWFETRERNT